MKSKRSEFRFPILTDRDGLGRCLGCSAELSEGKPHQENCPLRIEKKPDPVYVEIDPRKIAREVSNAIYSRRRQAEREELDRVAAAPPPKRKSRKGTAQ